jgi:5-methylthioribose kinase
VPQLRVADRWEASVERTETEVAALELLATLTPGVVPAILAHEPQDHVVAMELLPAEARKLADGDRSGVPNERPLALNA